MTFTLTNKKISGIPVLELYSLQAHHKRPLVIMMHGLTARKENVLPYAYPVAKEGYHTILFDAAEHGELETAQFRSYSNAQKKSHMYPIIFTSSENIDTIIEAFDGEQAVDHNRIGLIGFSMGGMMVYDYLCQMRSPQVKAAVPIIATPAWGKSVRRNLAEDPEYAKHLDEEEVSQIEHRQPSNFLAALQDFPLLILNGATDEIMPIDDTKEFYHRAKRYYTQQDLIQFIAYSGVGHTPTFEMISEAIAWLKKHL